MPMGSTDSNPTVELILKYNSIRGKFYSAFKYNVYL